MKKDSIKFDYVTDAEVLDRAIIYFNNLLPLLPTQSLRDLCAGLVARIFELRYFLISKKMVDYGNYSK